MKPNPSSPDSAVPPVAEQAADASAPSVPPGFPALSIEQAHARLTAPGARFELEERSIRGVRTRTWKNGPHTVRDVFAACAQWRERTFIVYEDERIRFAGFERAALRLAEELVADGVQPGDRVAIAMRNLPEWPVAYFAAALCGAIATPLNAWWSGAELAYGLVDSGAVVALVDGERYARLAPHHAEYAALRRMYVTRGSGQAATTLDARVRSLSDVLGPTHAWEALEPHFEPRSVDPEDDATIFYTSGTTGKPKGAVATHRNVVTNIWTQGFALARALLRRGEEPKPPSPEDPPRVALLAVPLFHVTGCTVTLLPAAYWGGKLVMMHKWDAERAMQLIERERATSAGGVPTIAWQLLEHPARSKYDLSSLLSISYGGAPAAPELTRKLRAAFPGAQSGNSWGMSETSGTFTSNYAEDYTLKPDSCGVPTAVGELKILDAAGHDVPVGQIGELWVKGPQVIRGYWQRPEETAKTFVDGWVRTGDLARVDAQGFCYIVDRAKDILIRGGENIYCIQVENALHEHPDVLDAAVVGIPHRTLGEEPGAVVRLREGSRADEAALRSFLAERLAAFEVPVRILFWSEPLPRNAAGKVLKRELKQAFLAAK